MTREANTGEAALQLSETLRQRSLRLVTAESCTGGMIATTLTDLPGSSEILERGFITYSNEAKHQMLDVSPSVIEAHGAVSSQVAQAMAEGALQHSTADLSVAVTGIAGPSGGSKAKPVGTVFIAAASHAPHCLVERHLFGGDRSAIRQTTVKTAFALITRLVDSHLP